MSVSDESPKEYISPDFNRPVIMDIEGAKLSSEGHEAFGGEAAWWAHNLRTKLFRGITHAS